MSILDKANSSINIVQNQEIQNLSPIKLNPLKLDPSIQATPKIGIHHNLSKFSTEGNELNIN